MVHSSAVTLLLVLGCLSSICHSRKIARLYTRVHRTENPSIAFFDFDRTISKHHFFHGFTGATISETVTDESDRTFSFPTKALDTWKTSRPRFFAVVQALMKDAVWPDTTHKIHIPVNKFLPKSLDAVKNEATRQRIVAWLRHEVFGGKNEGRETKLRTFFTKLQAANVKMEVITKGNPYQTARVLRLLDLLPFFSRITGIEYQSSKAVKTVTLGVATEEGKGTGKKTSTLTVVKTDESVQAKHNYIKERIGALWINGDAATGIMFDDSEVTTDRTGVSPPDAVKAGQVMFVKVDGGKALGQKEMDFANTVFGGHATEVASNKVPVIFRPPEAEAELVEGYSSDVPPASDGDNDGIQLVNDSSEDDSQDDLEKPAVYLDKLMKDTPRRRRSVTPEEDDISLDNLEGTHSSEGAYLDKIMEEDYPRRRTSVTPEEDSI